MNFLSLHFRTTIVKIITKLGGGGKEEGGKKGKKKKSVWGAV